MIEFDIFGSMNQSLFGWVVVNVYRKPFSISFTFNSTRINFNFGIARNLGWFCLSTEEFEPIEIEANYTKSNISIFNILIWLMRREWMN